MANVKDEKQKQEVIFAKVLDKSGEKDVGIMRDDRRHHMYILGIARTGKSTMLENMIYQDIVNGQGVAVVDEQGKLASRVLDSIPSYRINDVVYFNPADEEYPFGFNVLEDVDANYRHFLVVFGLIKVFKKMWPDIWGPQLEYILRNIILALLSYPGSTLLGIRRMLSDEEFRDRVIAHIDDREVKSFWKNEYPRYGEHLQESVIAPIQNRIWRLLSHPLVRNIVGQVKSKVNMRDVLDKGKIVIVNLSKARIGEDAATLLGAMMILKIQMTAMSRIDMEENKRRDFYLYIDGFNAFATDSFIETLKEAHTYNLNVIMAHQYIDQLVRDNNTGLRDALLESVGTMIIHKTSAEDSAFLSKILSSGLRKKVDVMNLDKHQVYIRLMVNGKKSKPFLAHTLSRIASYQGNKYKIITFSREQFAEPWNAVAEKIARWSGLIKPREQFSGKSSFYESQCDTCGIRVHISFIPDGIRPVLCKKCLESRERGREKDKEQKPSVSKEISLEQAMRKEPVSFKKKS